MRFLTRWLSKKYKPNDLAKSKGNAPNLESITGENIALSAINQDVPQVPYSYTAGETISQFSEQVSPGKEQSKKLEAPRAQPLVKTQAMIDSELVTTDAWWSAVEKGKMKWVGQLAKIQNQVSTLQSEGNAVFLMTLSAYFDLSSLDREGVLDESFYAQLRMNVEGLFDLHEFQKIMDEKTLTRWNSYPRSVDYYMGEFVIERPRYLEGVTHFVELIAENFNIVESHIKELSQAEREYNPYAGGMNLSAWKGFTRQFAKLHLIGIAPSDFFPEPAPRHLRDYRQNEMGVAGARFLWALMKAVQILSIPSGRSTSEVGIEFEKKLIGEISEAFPVAKIEPTPKTGDQGADVVLLIDGIKIVIQAKKYTGVVGNAGVQEVFAAKEYYDADYAMVVTNSRYTQSACTLAGKIGVELATAKDYLRKIQQLIV